GPKSARMRRPWAGHAMAQVAQADPHPHVQDGRVGWDKSHSRSVAPLMPQHRAYPTARWAVIGKDIICSAGPSASLYSPQGRSRAWRHSRLNESSRRFSRPTLAATDGWWRTTKSAPLPGSKPVGSLNTGG